MASYGCRELIEMGVVDILQTDINHVGGITGLWKVGALASFSNISMAPHACEGPIGGLATIRDAEPGHEVQLLAAPKIVIAGACEQQPTANLKLAGRDLRDGVLGIVGRCLSGYRVGVYPIKAPDRAVKAL